MECRCGICNSTDIEIVFRPREKNKVEKNTFNPTSSDFGIFYDLAKCRSCGGIFYILDAQDAQNIGKLYSESCDPLYLSQSAERSIAYNKILSHIKSLVPGNARLLDVGCSYGLFLKLASDSGFQPYGVEPSNDACRHCRDSLGLNVFCGDLKDANFPDNFFDVVTAIEVIEHIGSVRDFVNNIKRVLKPGGIFYLITPNIDSLSSKLMGYHWWSYRRMHLHYFSKKSILSLLDKNGFSIICSSPYKKTFKIDYIIHQLYRLDHSKIFYYFLLGFSRILKFYNLNITASFGDISVIAKKN